MKSPNKGPVLRGSFNKKFFSRLKKITSSSLVIFCLCSLVQPAFASEVDVKYIQPSEKSSSTETRDYGQLTPSNKKESNDVKESLSTSQESSEGEIETLQKSESVPPITNDASVSGENILDFSQNQYIPGKNGGINTSDGSFKYEIPITVPPGRNSMTPDTKLTYSNQGANDNDIFGYGWGINIPSIQLMNRSGVEKLYGTSTKYYSSSRSGELATTSVSGQFVARNEDGSFLTYTLASSTWTVVDKNGTTYLFGATTAGRQTDPTDSTKIYKWMLERVTDTNGNFITYSYTKDSGQIYPDVISYTNNVSSPGIFSINFTKASRSFYATSSDIGFPVVTKYKMTTIDVKINSSTVRSYGLTYTTGSNGNRLLLQSVSQTGYDESAVSVSLPNIEFSYALGTSTLVSDSRTSPIQLNTNGGSIGVDVLDVNGDGLPDITYSRNNDWGNIHEKKVYLNNGSTWTASSTWVLPAYFVYEYVSSPKYVDMGYRFADVNGDQLPDIISQSYIYLNTGSGWATSSISFPVPIVNDSKDAGVRILDINGDGLADIVRSYVNQATPATTTQVYLNNGNGWSTSTSWSIPGTITRHDTGTNIFDGGSRLIDINGDGLVDWIKGNQASGTDATIYMNNGSNWVVSSTTLPNHLDPWQGSVGFADFNNDGLTDVADSYYQNYGLMSDGWKRNDIYLNNGNGWTLDSSRQLNIPVGMNDQTTGQFFIDVNGDGLTDSLTNSDNTVGNYWYSNQVSLGIGTKSDVINSIHTAEGGYIIPTYKGSGAYLDSNGKIANPKLPNILYAVSKIETLDGINSATSTTRSYLYDGGVYDFGSTFNRRPVGFGGVSITGEKGTTKTTLNTDSYRANTPSKVEVKDLSGNLYRAELYTWDLSSTTASSSNYVKLSQKITMDYDGDSGHRDSAHTYTYDSLGNKLTDIDWGEVTGTYSSATFSDTGSDKYTSTVTYASSTAAHIYVPSDISTVDQSAVKINQKRLYYDAQLLGTVTKGNITKEEDWKSGSSYINSQKTYDSFGLVASSTDPRGKVTGYVYDSNKLYPATITNPLSQSTSYTYDYSLGKPKQITDPNGLVTQTIYDGFDRVTEEKIPDLVTPASLVTKNTYEYTDNTTPTKVKKTSYLTSATTSESYVYSDGLGRAVQTRVQSENPSTFAVSNVAFNKDGLKKSESLPYFASSSSYSTPVSTSAFYTNYTYDPLQRIIQTSSVTGNTLQSYDNWGTTITDPYLHYKELKKDAFGNLVEVKEHNGASTYTTSYVWNGNNKLTNITDASGNIRNFTYDGLGRRLSMEDLHGSADTSFGKWYFEFDDAGNMSSSTDPKSQVVNYTYDDLNRVTQENYLGDAGVELRYVYDSCTYGIGQLCSAGSNSATTTYVYNSNGGIDNETKNVGGTNYVNSYVYDRLGNINNLTYPDGSSVNYTFNSANKIEKIDQKESGGSYRSIVSNFNYGPHGMITFQVDGNNASTTKTYDENELYRLRNIHTSATYPTGGGGEDLEAAEQNLVLTDDGKLLYTDEKGEIKDLTEVPPPESIPSESTDATSTKEIPVEPDPLPVLVEDPVVIVATTSDPFIEVPFVEATSTEELLIQDVPEVIEISRAAIDESIDQDKVFIKRDSPEVRISKWNGEVDFSISYGGVTGLSAYDSKSKKIEWGKEGQKVQVYQLDAQEGMERGGIEMEVVLDQKPESNIFSFNLTGTENLNFFYQPSLAETNDAKKYECTETQCIDAEGNIVNERPENIVGSYAVYYKNALDHEIGGTNYQTGKVFNIYRPKIIDSEGKTVWGELRYDNNLLTVTVPQSFLETAAYPVTVDPTFGLTTLGGSSKSSALINGVPGVPYLSGTVTGIHLYGVRSSSPNKNVGVALYSDVSGAPSTLLVTDSGNVSFTSTQKWADYSLSATVSSSSPYWMMYWGSGAVTTYYDAVYQISSYKSGLTFESWPSTMTGTSVEDYKFSMYADYSPGIPNATSLLVEGTTSPAHITTFTPKFSSVFIDPDAGDYASHYQIQVATSSGFSTAMWDTTKTVMASTTVSGQRSPDVTYGGPAINASTTYYWRMRYWDNGGSDSGWSTSTNSFSYAPITPISPLFVGGIQDVTYTYDLMGNIIHIIDTSNTNAFGTTTYVYDDLYRLTSASSSNNASTTPYLKTYTYDGLGNITNQSVLGSYTYAGNMGANYANPHAVTLIGSSTYAYDNNGNLTSVTGGLTNTWNYLNQLVQTVQGTTTTYAYDHTGSRIKKNNGVATTYYPSRFYEITGASSTKNIFAGSDLVASVDGTGSSSVVYFNHLDHLGSTVASTDQYGYMTQLLNYYPYGQMRLDEKYGGINQNNRFTGHEYDSETALNYMNARYYEGSRGQFLSQDPVFRAIGNKAEIQEKTGLDMTVLLSDPQQLNSYSYGRNNPIRYSDPTGNLSWDALLNSPVDSIQHVMGWGVASLGVNAINRPFTADLLRHSASLNPGDVNIDSGNQKQYGNVVDSIKGTSQYQGFVNQAIENAKNGQNTTSGSLQFDKGDLYTSLHRANIQVGVEQTKDGWTTNTTISDRYDFNPTNSQTYKGTVTRIPATQAYKDQQKGVLSNYNVNIKISDKIKK